MEKFDVVVVGAGLGGLQSAYILAKNGKKVCVLEQNALIGGCIQTFKRRDQIFDTGFHYIGGLDENQPLNKLFKYFNLMDLPFQKMDDCFDKVVYKGKTYKFMQGFENFYNQMLEYFPNSKDELRKYVDFLKNVGENIFDAFNNIGQDMQNTPFSMGAYEFLCKTISDADLREVLSGTCLKMQLDKEKLPLYIFAQINSSFIQSAYRIKGGGMLIAEKLKENIQNLGGKVLTNSKVVEFIENEGKISSVKLENGQEVFADVFVSNAHPSVTASLAKNTSFFRKIYISRISKLENSFGMFTANIRLKKGKIKYQNQNTFIHTSDDIWAEKDNLDAGINAALISYMPAEDDSIYTQGIDLLCPISYKEVEKWENTVVFKRGEDYLEFKKQKAEELIKYCSPYIENLEDSIEQIYTSTPLTYRDYTSSPNGSAYGICKDFTKPLQTFLTPKTPAPNLFLTGQNLNLHGILGVSMSSFITCMEIIKIDFNKILN